MHLGTSLLELIVHRVIDEVPREPCSLSLVALLLLHPAEEEDLGDDYAPQDAPDD